MVVPNKLTSMAIAGAIVFAAIAILLRAGDEYVAASWVSRQGSFSWDPSEGPLNQYWRVFGHRFVELFWVSAALVLVCIAVAIWPQVKALRPVPDSL